MITTSKCWPALLIQPSNGLECVYNRNRDVTETAHKYNGVQLSVVDVRASRYKASDPNAKEQTDASVAHRKHAPGVTIPLYDAL